MRIHKEYPYLYETHLHTNQASACAWNTGYEMAKAAHEAGYSGIVVTDHNWGGNTCVDRSLPWEEWVERYAAGWADAGRYALEHPDFKVFFGCEAGFSATEFLIYGITPEWMKAHPEIRNASLEEFLTLVRAAGFTAIHAHPFREEWYISQIRLYPHLVDGVEGINATHSCSASQHHNHRIFDERAIAYARENGLPMSAGSDIHSTALFGGGVAFRRKMESVEDMFAVIVSGGDYVMTNGDDYFDKNGVKLD